MSENRIAPDAESGCAGSEMIAEKAEAARSAEIRVG